MGNSLKTFVMDSGERYCILIDTESGLPLFYPNLYITTQVRNKSLSYSAMESTLGGIAVLLRFLANREENIQSRFAQNNFLKEFELDAIRDFCQTKFRFSPAELSNKEPFILHKQRESNEIVSNQTQYVRLTVIAQFTKWLAEHLSETKRDKNALLQIEKMAKGLKSRRPLKKNRNPEINEKGLTKEQIELLFELFRPEADLNPFSDKGVKTRNRLMFLILYHLGLRGGELLNIRIRDINFGKNQLVVVRRADEKGDTRKYQPLVKTLDRRLPLKNTLIQELHHYIINERKNIPNASKHDFLFVTHKSGPSQGHPLSKSSYKKVMEAVRKTSPTLYNLTGHQLRHSWNELFSNLMDSMNAPPSQEKQEKLRSYLMGWSEGSGTASTYNKRFIREKAREAALKLQEGLIRTPRGFNHE